MDPGRIAIRCLASFIVLLVLVRLSGKRTVSQGTAFDFVLSLIIGDLVDDVIYAEVPFTNFLVAAGTLTMMEIIASIFVHRSGRLMWLLEGRPGILLKEGRLDSRAMSDEQFNEKDVSCLLRLKGVDQEKWSQLKLATIESEGQLAVLRKPAMKAAQKKDRKRLEHSNA